jgi:hypothetical protein
LTFTESIRGRIKLAKSKPCTGCGDLIHFDEKDHAKTKTWRPFNEDNEPHYCGASKKETTSTVTTVSSEQGDVMRITLSAREWTNLREEINVIHMQLSEIRAVLKAMNEPKEEQQQEEERTQVSGVKYESDSIEDQINAIDFDKMFSESNPS